MRTAHRTGTEAEGRRLRAVARRIEGQSLAEFALIAPIFIFTVIGIFDVGRLVWANNVVGSAAREAARFAISNGGTATTACPVGPPAGTALPPLPGTCPWVDSFTTGDKKAAIRDVAKRFTIAGGSGTTVYVCYGASCSGDVDATGATNARGTPMTVAVRTTVALVIPRVMGLAKTVPVNGKTTMLVSH